MKKFIYICVIILFFILGILTTNILLNKKINVEELKKSLVYIESINDDETINATGFVYKKDKNYDYILTCFHVVNNNDYIYVYNQNKEKIKGEIYSFDENKDIAIIKVENKLNLKKMKIGNSDKLEVSDEIYVLSNPIDFTYFGTLSKGVISSLNRKINVEEKNINTIQIDSNITLGSSGGALINKKGEVVTWNKFCYTY